MIPFIIVGSIVAGVGISEGVFKKRDSGSSSAIISFDAEYSTFS